MLVIDGGWERDTPYLRLFLRSLGRRVHTWFVTHQHDDHIGALTSLLRQSKSKGITRNC
jgi:glyoxylase-like metal-dependent hydrolase (beta-lactamase superfamily II)